MRQLFFSLFLVVSSFTGISQMTDAQIFNLFETVDKIDKAETYHKDFTKEINAVSPENRELVRNKIDQLIAKSQKESLKIIRKRFTPKELEQIALELPDKTLFVYSEKTVSFIRYWQSFRRDFFDEITLLLKEYH